ncbi:MAG TPA: Ig domain-containing protein [Patescibacteria group bacterium]|nr:Ig domain-containing protein [Patescibacteria group bacterium]
MKNKATLVTFASAAFITAQILLSTIPARAASITLSQTAATASALGSPVRVEYRASGGTAPYTFAVTAGTLPDGLSLRKVKAEECQNVGFADCFATTAVLEGTPTRAGNFAFTVTATDSTGQTGTQAFNLNVTDGKSPSIIVTGPVQNTVIKRKHAYEITWQATNYTLPVDQTKATVTVTLHPANTAVNPLVLTTTANENGKFLWLVPQDLSTGFEGAAYFSVAINGTGLVAKSNSVTISSEISQGLASFTVLTPQTGDVFRLGRTNRITWKSVGYPGSVIKLLLYPIRPECAVTCDASLKVPFTIIDNTSNLDYYDWTPAANFPYTGPAYVSVVSNDSGFSGASGIFNLLKAEALNSNVQLTYPSGFESWQIGTVQTIKWNLAPQPSAYTIGLYLKHKDFGEGLLQYVNPVPNGGSFNLTIPNYIILPSKEAKQINPGAYYFVIKVLSQNPCDSFCDGSVGEQVVSSDVTSIPVIIYDSLENEQQVYTTSKLLGYKNQNFTAVFQSQVQGATNWRVTSGSLPQGLSLKTLASTQGEFAELSGSPWSSGLYRFSLTADASGGIYTGNFQMAVLDAVGAEAPTEVKELAREASLSRFKAVKAGKVYYYITKDEEKIKLTAQYSKFKKTDYIEVNPADMARYNEPAYVKLAGSRSIYKVENGSRRLLSARLAKEVFSDEISIIPAYAFYSLKLGKSLK